VFFSNPGLAELLIQNGALINEKDSLGKTPLAMALQSKKNAVAEVLKKHGAKK
jgi:ankyrin repeat protein